MNIAIGADDKKKFIALGGLLAVVLLIFLYLLLFRPKSSTTTVAQNSTPPQNIAPPGMEGGPGAGQPPEETGAPTASSGSGSVTAISLASLSGPQVDPFTPQYILPPVPLAQPESLPAPSGYAGLPPAYVGGNASTVMMGLPPIHIPGVAQTPTAPQKFEAPKEAGGTPLASPSFNKRLSGVIIGDSVHALLEITDASGTHTYVVQPGDTIAGIRVLDIQRVDVGGRTVPRMLIRENGENAYVDLRPSPITPTDPQSSDTSAPGGLPGNPGTFPGPSILPAPNMSPGQQIGRGTNPFSAN